jgi:hypothetical protein
VVKLAGKYANVISRNPIASAVAGGLGAAGLATLGNVLSGEAQTEQGGRLGLEAVGAGALGAVLGAQIPALRGKASQLYRNIGNVSLENPGAVARKAQMSPREIQQAEFMRDILNETVKTGVVSPQQMRDDIKTSLKRSQAGINAGVIPAGVLAAGALGGMTGGGIANLAAGMGLPGMGIDPEGYGSNNTPSAQFGVKSLASTQYV